MSNLPARPCRQAGCPELIRVRHGYCNKHSAANRDARVRSNADLTRDRTFYGSSQWKKLRAWYRARHPLCEECSTVERPVAMNVVDHKTPIEEGGSKLAVDNLQSLCDACHNRKRGREGQRYSRA